jgi:hypothetical protein
MPRAPEGVPYALRTTIADMHAAGASTHTIAAALNRTVGRHPQGMRWTAGVGARELPAAGVGGSERSVQPERKGQDEITTIRR